VTLVVQVVRHLARALDHRPRHAGDLVPALHRGAVSNAHDALDDLQRAVAEREALHAGGARHVRRMSLDETVALLERQEIGRLAYVARTGTPDLVPVNYAWVDGQVLIRSGPGPKLQAAERGDTVAFEVDEIDVDRREARSAVVLGKASVVDPLAAPAVVDVWAEGPRRRTIRIVPTRVEGRRLG
jgi:uncharacterized protein